MANDLQFNVKARTKEVQLYLKDVNGKAKRAATRRSINKTITKVRTEASKSIRRYRTLKAREVKERLRVNKANYRTLTATIKASRKPIPLKRFKHGSRKIRKRNRWGQQLREVWVEVEKGKKQVIRGAFIGPQNHIFMRKTRGGKPVPRLPIRKLFGPTVGSGMLKREVLRAMNDVANETFDRNFRHEMQREIDKAARKRR